MNNPRPPLWKRILRFSAFALIALPTVLALIASVISFQGRREWAKTRTDLLARGEKLSLIEFVPPTVPDDRNFFAAPMWHELIAPPAGTQSQLAILKEPPSASEIDALRQTLPSLQIDDKRSRPQLASRLLAQALKQNDPALGKAAAGAALSTLQPLAPLTTAVQELLLRPEARFPVEYEKGFIAPIPHITPILALGKIFSDRAEASIIHGDPASARTDMLDALRLTRTLEGEPFLISLLVRIAIIQQACEAIDTGIRLHVWRDEDLTALQKPLAKIDLLPDLALALRGERGAINTFLQSLRASDSKAFDIWFNERGGTVFHTADIRFYLAVFAPGDQAFGNNFLQQNIDAITAAAGVDAAALDTLERKFLANHSKSLMDFISAMLIPETQTTTVRTARAQDQVHLTLIASALERYRLANHAYPSALGQLVPDFLAALPVSTIGHRAFEYRLENADHFRLWSTGWDGADDNGEPSKKRGDYAHGDWPFGATQ